MGGMYTNGDRDAHGRRRKIVPVRLMPAGLSISTAVGSKMNKFRPILVCWAILGPNFVEFWPFFFL